MKTRNAAIDKIRGFAILLVMAGHCIVLNGLADSFVYDIINAIQMPLFMTVSGYLAGFSKVPGDVAGFAKSAGKRAVSCLIPFFSWMVLTHLRNPWEEFRLELFQLDRGLWFLMTLFLIALMVLLAQFLVTRIRQNTDLIQAILFLGILMILYALPLLQARSGNTFLSPSLTVKYLPFYLAGFLLSHYLPVFMEQSKWVARLFLRPVLWTLWGISLPVFLGAAAFFDLVHANSTLDMLIQMAASFLGTFLAFYGIARLSEKGLGGWLVLPGMYTLEIYVLHFRFARLLGIAQKNLTLYSLEGVLWVLAAFAVMAVLTAAGILVLRHIPVVSFLLFGKTALKVGAKKGTGMDAGMDAGRDAGKDKSQ